MSKSNVSEEKKLFGKIEDDTIIITDIVDGSFQVMEKRGERNDI